MLDDLSGCDPIYDIHWEAWVDAYSNDTIESLQDIIREEDEQLAEFGICLLYTSPSPRDLSTSRMPSSA